MHTAGSDQKPRFVRCMFYMHDTLISGFAAISFGLIALMPFLIVYDAVARTIGWQPPLWSVPFIEYALLFIVVMGAPWLLRKNGHVTIEVLSMQLSDRRRILLEKAAYMLSSLACWVTSFFGARLAYEAAKSGSYDVRSISVPETYIYSLLAFGFLLLAIEFAIQGIRGRATGTPSL